MSEVKKITQSNHNQKRRISLFSTNGSIKNLKNSRRRSGVIPIKVQSFMKDTTLNTTTFHTNTNDDSTNLILTDRNSYVRIIN